MRFPMSKQEKIRFSSSSSDFHRVLKLKIDAYFNSHQLSRYGNWQLWLKSIVLVLATVLVYTAIISQMFSPWILLMLCGVLGVLKGSIGFIICHDALHGTLSPSPKVNRACGYIFDLLGMSSLIWKITHNHNHHIYTNIHGKDHDIDKAILLRFSPQDRLYWFHQYQHVYIFILYFFTGLAWITYGDYRFLYLQRKEFQNSEIWLTLLLKGCNLLIFLGLPLLFMSLPAWQILTGYLISIMVGGFYIAIIFQLAHLVEDVSFPTPNLEGDLPYAWAVHEMHTTSNFAVDSFWAAFFLGGLNFQIEHHLFANISHVHYPKISRIVKQTAQEFNLPYHEQKTVLAAIKSHIKTVRALGRPQTVFSAELTP